MRTLQRLSRSLTQRARLATAAGVLAVSLSPAAHAGLFDFLNPPKNETQTQYPIILVHGLFGFGQALGTIDYFWGIVPDLRAGGAKVYIAELPALDSADANGEKLLRQIDTILAQTGAKKVNIFAHSYGGISARYVAGVAPEKIASITSVSGAHKGSKLADLVSSAVNVIGGTDSAGGKLVAAILNTVMRIQDAILGKPDAGAADAIAALGTLDTAGMAKYNERFPAGLPPTFCGSNGAEVVNGVRYYSWTGSQPVTNLLDPFDWMTAVTQVAHGGLPNDGINDNCTQRLGKVIGDYKMNHFDEVNQLAGLRGLFTPDPVALWHQQAVRMKQLGL